MTRWLLAIVALLSALSLAFGSTASAATIRGVVIDANSESPLPCRFYVQAADGSWHFATSADAEGSSLKYSVERGPKSFEKHVTLSAHPFTVEVPPGKTTITVELGKEYIPLVKEVTAGSEPVEIELPLARWIDMPARGWYSGDTHIHRKLEEVPQLMLAEDLHVALPLTYWVTSAYEPAVRGARSGELKPELIQVAKNRFLWPVNTEYELFNTNGKPHTQGAVFVLNQRGSLDLATPPVTPVANAAHESGALLDLDKHTWNWSPMIVPIMQVDLFELANNHIWRTEFAFKQWTIDVLPKDWKIETDAEGYTEWGWTDWGFKTYYAFLNCGFRMRPTGGTAAGVHPVPAGFGRVYVHVEGEFTYQKWIDGLNAGHSFVTTGPMLLVHFNGKPGGTVYKGEDAKQVRITGSCESLLPLNRIEIVVNGDVARTLRPANTKTNSGGYASPIDETLPLATSSWAIVRCFEKQPDGRQRFAHSAPAHLEIDGPVKPKRREVTYFIGRIEHEIARNRGVLKAEELAEYERALEIYRKLAERTRD
jgi:hypothetical protein